MLRAAEEGQISHNNEKTPLLEGATTLYSSSEAIEAILSPVISDARSGNLSLKSRDKIASTFACAICLYGVLLFLGPNYYDNTDDTEFLRIWYSTWSLVYNFSLNSYFSVAPLQEIYDTLKSIGKNLFSIKCSGLASALVDSTDLLHKVFWACCASYIYVDLITHIPWIPTNKVLYNLMYVAFFASYLPMNLSGINALFDIYLKPLIKDFFRQFVLMISDSPSSLRRLKKNYLINQFQKNFRETLLGLIKQKSKSIKNADPSLADFLNKHGDFQEHTLMKTLADALQNTSTARNSRFAANAILASTGFLTIVVITGFFGYFRDTIPSQNASESINDSIIFAYLIAMASIIANIGLSLIMSQETSQDIIESLYNIFINRNVPLYLKSFLSKSFFVIFQLVTFGFASQTIKGSLVLNEAFQNEVSPVVYRIITGATASGSTFFNGFALSNFVMSLQQYLYMRFALKRSTPLNPSKESYFYQKLHDKLNDSKKNDLVLLFASELAGACRNKEDFFDQNPDYKKLANNYNLLPEDFKNLVRHLISNNFDAAGELLLKNNPQFSAGAYRRKFVNNYVINGAIPSFATWLMNELLLSFYVISKSETAAQFFMPALSYLPFSMMKLASHAVKSAYNLCCSSNNETSIIPAEKKSCCASFWSKASWATLSTLAPLVAGYGTELIVSSSAGPIAGCDDEISAYIGKSCGTLAAAVTAANCP